MATKNKPMLAPLRTSNILPPLTTLAALLRPLCGNPSTTSGGVASAGLDPATDSASVTKHFHEYDYAIPERWCQVLPITVFCPPRFAWGAVLVFISRPICPSHRGYKRLSICLPVCVVLGVFNANSSARASDRPKCPRLSTPLNGIEKDNL
jgi:hypothetical protein